MKRQMVMMCVMLPVISAVIAGCGKHENPTAPSTRPTNTPVVTATPNRTATPNKTATAVATVISTTPVATATPTSSTPVPTATPVTGGYTFEVRAEAVAAGEYYQSADIIACSVSHDGTVLVGTNVEDPSLATTWSYSTAPTGYSSGDVYFLVSLHDIGMACIINPSDPAVAKLLNTRFVLTVKKGGSTLTESFTPVLDSGTPVITHVMQVSM